MAPWPPAVYCSSSAILAIDLLYAGILLFVSFMATVKDIKKLLEEEIRPITSKLLSIEEKFSELQLAVDYLSGKYDELLKKIQSSNDKTGKLTADVRIVKQDLSITQKRSVEAKKEIDELAQYLRRDCVEISGLKPNDEVDCSELVKTIGKEMGMDLGDEDISIAHPLPTFNQATDSKLIVKFTRRAVRDEFYASRKEVAGKKASSIKSLKDLEVQSLDLTKKVYISESLTPTRKKLFGSLNKLKKDLKWKFIWTNNGRIFLKKAENSSRTFKFESVDDLENFKKKELHQSSLNG